MENTENINVNENTQTETTQTEEVKTYTQEEINELFKKWESDKDRAVTQAIKTNSKKYEKQLSLAKLDDDERAKAEKDNRIAELEEQLAQFQIEKNRSELKSVLASRGLSAEFADIIDITDDIEASQAKIDKLDKLIKASVKTEVERRLAGNAPKGNGGTNVLTKETFENMTTDERQALYQRNPELYKALRG